MVAGRLCLVEQSRQRFDQECDRNRPQRKVRGREFLPDDTEHKRDDEKHNGEDGHTRSRVRSCAGLTERRPWSPYTPAVPRTRHFSNFEFRITVLLCTCPRLGPR